MIIEEEQQKAFDFINQTIVANKKVSHAYLIETRNYENYNYFVKQLIKKILLLNIKEEQLIKKIELEVNNDNYPDVKYINPEGYWIKKEQLISLEKEFSKKSMLDNKLIYIINGADKLNDSSANTILKFLEEPNEDIIAILITSNRYKVLETILSRCQIISLKEKQNINFENENIKTFFDDIIKKRSLIVNFDNYYENLFIDKINSKQTLESLENMMFFYINTRKHDRNIYIKYINIFQKENKILEYNVNQKLWLNDLIIRLMEVNKNV